MQAFGHRSARLLAGRAGWPWVALGLLVTVIPAFWMWGFTVDDALIPVRYARHLVAGMGWRFDKSAASTDGVTPLPWPLVLAPMARTGDALQVLLRAKSLGLAAWALAGAFLGRAVGQEREAPVWARGAILTAMGLSIPLAAHAVSGMETALATLLATSAAVSSRRPMRAAVVAGLCASLRPEMAPWACVLAAGLALAARQGAVRAAAGAVVALVPFTVCAAVRVAVWGRPAPLALWAKPSDLGHGFAYAGAALVVAIVPILVAAPRAVVRSPRAIALVCAALAHVVAIMVVGGDWMPYARLIVPVLPSIGYAAVLAAAHARPFANAVRCISALALGVVFVVRNGNDGRRVGMDRAALIALAGPWLRPARRVAALDVGWVGAATDADIVDLAGVTDPEVAFLPGGHTSKRVGAMYLLERDADALLLYTPSGLHGAKLSEWQSAEYTRAVEARLAHDDVIVRQFVPEAWLPLGPRGAGYVLLRRRAR